MTDDGSPGESAGSGVASARLDQLLFLFRQLDDPYPVYAELRENAPVLAVPDLSARVVTGHAEAAAVLSDRRFSADRRRSAAFGRLPPPPTSPGVQPALELLQRTLLTTDPPAHTRQRALLAKAFTPKMVEGLRPRVEGLAHELLAAADERGEIDLVGEFAYPLPVIVIADLLGLPRADREQLKSWSDDLAQMFQLVPPPEAYERFAHSARDLRAYFEAAFYDHRRNPRDDLLTALVTSRDEQGTVGDEDLLALCVLVLAAGHETTTNLIGNAALALLRHPDERRRMVEGLDDQGFVRRAVEELLRYDPPVQRTARVAGEDLELGGAILRRGDLVMVVFAAANRDPRVFAAPNRLDLGRSHNPHLSFGQGIHFCLGAALARLEAQVALTALLRRFPDLDGDASSVTWKPVAALRGLESLPLALR